MTEYRASIKMFEQDTVLKLKQAGDSTCRRSASLAAKLESLKWCLENGFIKERIEWPDEGGMKKTSPIELYEAKKAELKAEYEKNRKTRGVISSWTYSARRRTNLALRNGMQKMHAEFVLTLPGENPCMDGKIIKKCLDRLEAEFRKQGNDWFWIQEWQDRGAWHGHVCVSKWPDEAWLRRKWADIVLAVHPGISDRGAANFRLFCLGGYLDREGKPRAQVRRIEQKKFYAWYLRKYMGKDENKVVPDAFQNPGRFSGWSAGFLTFVEKFFNPDEGLGKLFVRYARRHRKAELRSWSTGHFKKKKFAARFMPGTVGFVHWNGAGFVKKFYELFQPEFLKMAI